MNGKKVKKKGQIMNIEQKRLLALVYNQNVALESIRGLLKLTKDFIDERCNSDIEEIKGFRNMIIQIHKTSQKAYYDSNEITYIVENMVK